MILEDALLLNVQLYSSSALLPLYFSMILLSPLWKNKCSLSLGLPFSAPDARIVMLVMSGDLSVAHFTARTSANDLASTLITGKWAADTTFDEAALPPKPPHLGR